MHPFYANRGRGARRPGNQRLPGAAPIPSADHEIRIFADVPFSDSTRIFTPAAGSLTPWFGNSVEKYFWVSSNSGCPACPRT